MKRKWIVILIIIGVIGGGTRWGYTRFLGSPPDDTESRPITVEARDIISSITGTGTVVPSNRVEIKPPIPGRVDRILVAEGESVKKGEIIAWMSSTDRAALLDQARSKGDSEVKKWEDMLRPAPLIAPITGTVIYRPVEGGQTVAASDVLLVVADRLKIQVQIDETDIGKVKIGQSVSIELDAYSNRKFKGTVRHIGYEAKLINNVTVYLVDVIPKAPPFEMRSGMTAYVSFVASAVYGTPALPVEAIRSRGGRSFVLVQHDKEKPQSVPVEIGLSDGRYTQILSGVDVGTRVTLPRMSSGKKSGSSNPMNPQSGRSGGLRRQ